jgi:hypothetical protein
MTRDDAEEAIKALARAIDALSKEPPDTKRAAAEITEAIAVIERVPDVYADKALRPGLNFHQEPTP